MVEVLKRGVPDDERVHDVTCRRCKSELRFVQKEAQVNFDDRDGSYFTITCPVCGSSVSKLASDGNLWGRG